MRFSFIENIKSKLLTIKVKNSVATKLVSHVREIKLVSHVRKIKLVLADDMSKDGCLQGRIFLVSAFFCCQRKKIQRRNNR